MPELMRPTEHVEEHPEHHEHTDVRAKPLIIFGVGFFVFAVVAHLVLYFLFGLYDSLKEERGKRQGNSIVQEAQVTPEPRIQGVPGFNTPTPRQDLYLMQEQLNGILNSYGASDQRGYARIPIDRAMELLVKQGLPRTPATRPTMQPR